MRARLEMAVGQILLLASGRDHAPLDSDYTSDTEDAPVVLCNEELTTAVRKELAMSLKDLIQHGLMPVSSWDKIYEFSEYLKTENFLRNKLYYFLKKICLQS